MIMPKTMSGKLLCSLGYHKLVTQARRLSHPSGSRAYFDREERKCTRCGFSYLTGEPANKSQEEKTT